MRLDDLKSCHFRAGNFVKISGYDLKTTTVKEIMEPSFRSGLGNIYCVDKNIRKLVRYASPELLLRELGFNQVDVEIFIADGNRIKLIDRGNPENIAYIRHVYYALEELYKPSKTTRTKIPIAFTHDVFIKAINTLESRGYDILASEIWDSWESRLSTNPLPVLETFQKLAESMYVVFQGFWSPLCIEEGHRLFGYTPDRAAAIPYLNNIVTMEEVEEKISSCEGHMKYFWQCLYKQFTAD